MPDLDDVQSKDITTEGSAAISAIDIFRLQGDTNAFNQVHLYSINTRGFRFGVWQPRSCA